MDLSEEFGKFEKLAEELGISKEILTGKLPYSLSRERFRLYENDFVIITRSELDQLREDADSFNKLLTAGVDNWEGYEQAMDD